MFIRLFIQPRPGSCHSKKLSASSSQSKLRAGGLKHLAEFPQLDFPRKCVVLKPPAKDR